jgi:hypothetical protein
MHQLYRKIAPDIAQNQIRKFVAFARNHELKIGFYGTLQSFTTLWPPAAERRFQSLRHLPAIRDQQADRFHLRRLCGLLQLGNELADGGAFELLVEQRLQFAAHQALAAFNFLLRQRVLKRRLRRLEFDAEAVFRHGPARFRQIDQHTGASLVPVAVTVHSRLMIGPGRLALAQFR